MYNFKNFANKKNKFTLAIRISNIREQDSRNAVQSSLKSFTLWITLYIVTKYYIFIRKNVCNFSELTNICFRKNNLLKSFWSKNYSKRGFRFLSFIKICYIFVLFIPKRSFSKYFFFHSKTIISKLLIRSKTIVLISKQSF